MATTENDINIFIDMLHIWQSEGDFQRLPMEVENSLLEKICKGQYQDIKMASFSQLDNNVASMATGPLTTYTYLTVSAIAIFSRTVISCGIAPDEAFDLSDSLLYALSLCKTSDDIHEIYQLSAVMFAKLVHRQNTKNLSYQIGRTLNYISRNIYRKITLEEVAAYVDLSPNYLCNLFTREMGLSLHNYIQQEKVSVACNLLMHTDRSVSDIASYMGFQTQSNFAAVFRKWKGMTPSQFREQNYKEVF